MHSIRPGLVVVLALAAAGIAADAARAAQAPELSGTLIVTNKAPSTATIVDVASGTTLATLPTGAGPHEVAVSGDGSVAVVTDYGGQPRRTLTVIDVPGLRVAKTIDLGPYTAPHGIVFLPGGGDSLVVVTSETTGNIVVVDLRSGAVVKAIATNGQMPHMVGVTGDGARAYVGNMRSNTVSEMDLRTGRFTRSWNVPMTPEGINVTSDGKEVWVGSNATGKVTVIEPATGAMVTAADGVQFPYRMAFTPDLTVTVIPDARGEEMRFIDRALKTELGRIALRGGGPQGVTITPDGRYAFQSLSTGGRVAIVDIAKRAVVRELLVGEAPDGVAYTTRVVRR
jgi:DNA-binding beta-propeller fold protein YncE